MRQLVTIEKIQEKKPIEGADKTEAVRVRSLGGSVLFMTDWGRKN